jgi:hypothetical protein
MAREIVLARLNNIPVTPMSPGTVEAYTRHGFQSGEAREQSAVRRTLPDILVDGTGAARQSDVMALGGTPVPAGRDDR